MTSHEVYYRLRAASSFVFRLLPLACDNKINRANFIKSTRKYLCIGERNPRRVCWKFMKYANLNRKAMKVVSIRNYFVESISPSAQCISRSECGNAIPTLRAHKMEFSLSYLWESRGKYLSQIDNSMRIEMTNSLLSSVKSIDFNGSKSDWRIIYVFISIFIMLLGEN